MIVIKKEMKMFKLHKHAMNVSVSQISFIFNKYKCLFSVNWSSRCSLSFICRNIV